MPCKHEIDGEEYGWCENCEAMFFKTSSGLWQSYDDGKRFFSDRTVSESQRKLDASVSPEQASEYVRKERERNASRDNPYPAPKDGFINDYD